MADTPRISQESHVPESAVKTVLVRKDGEEGVSGRVSIRTLKEMIAHWEIGPNDFIRLEGDPVERRVREYPALSPLDEMLQEVNRKVLDIRRGQGRRSSVIRELQMLMDYAEQNDRVYSVACLLLGYLRYAENPALARGLFLKALERGFPIPAVARNNLAVAQIRLGDPAGRDNLIMAANDPRRPSAALSNLAKLLQHLQRLGEKTDEIANVKDLQRVARAEWQKAAPGLGDPTSFALFLCEGDIPASFASSTRSLSKAQGRIEDILAEGEDCLQQGRIEQALAHAARATAEIDRVREDLEAEGPGEGISPLRFLSVRLSRLENAAKVAREARESQSQLEVFRQRLRAIEQSLELKVPPGDLIQQAEILVDSSGTEAERAEAENILRECQDRVARHLLETAGELLSAGEKGVAMGLLQKAQSLDSRVSDEIKLRVASVRRDEIEEEIAGHIASEQFEVARAKIALLRTIHPIFEPVATRLEGDVRLRESTRLIERVTDICGSRAPAPEAVREARRLFERARTLHVRPATLNPVEDELLHLEGELGIEFSGRTEPPKERGGQQEAASPAPLKPELKPEPEPEPEPEEPRAGFSLEPENKQEDPGSTPS